MKKALAFLAAFCHGISAAMNILGIVYNLIQVRRGKEDNIKDVLFHTFELAYHLVALYAHIQESREQ